MHVIGDFNANLSKQSVFGEMLLNFCSENNSDIVDKNYPPCRHVYTCQLSMGHHSMARSCCVYI